ncbi:MAG: hypothetical protein ACQESR_02435 [Planctomycetota bacterium]
MSDSIPKPSPVSGADNAGFETMVTPELLQRFQEELIEIKGAFGTCRANQVRTKMRPWFAASNPGVRRTLIALCFFGAVIGAPFGIIMSWSEADRVGTAVWIGIDVLFVTFGVLFAMAPRIHKVMDTLTDRWRAKIDARVEEQIQGLLKATPYKVRHKLDSTNSTWTVHSERTGEQACSLSPEMTAYRGDVAYILLKTDLLARPVLSAIVETADQRKQLDQFVQSCGVRVVDAREIDRYDQA